MSDDRPLVVIADAIDAEAIQTLQRGECRVLDLSGAPAKLETELPAAWGLIVRSRTKVTADLLAKAPRLRIVARAGVGVDNVDMAAATARGIQVVNAPTAATTSVAELTLALYLLLVRDLVGPIVETRAGSWKRGTHGHELEGRTIGFIGYGRIAREVARRARAFGMRTVAYDPLLTGTPDDGTPLRTLDELLGACDLLSIHAALTPENHHLISAPQLARMRRGSFLVNVARGALVDEVALVEALRSEQLAGAALDVFEVEPPTRQELLSNPRVIPTPHLGASTHEAQSRAGAQVVEEMLRALRREPLRFQVNREVAPVP
ncbi:MAG TPA: hydroxyacid dehydrogenase [Thermoplasmata archaeon]|nr:hydroxyacid dehydrogenase [Thermoplasmata archaeon]